MEKIILTHTFTCQTTNIQEISCPNSTESRTNFINETLRNVWWVGNTVAVCRVSRHIQIKSGSWRIKNWRNCLLLPLMLCTWFAHQVSGFDWNDAEMNAVPNFDDVPEFMFWVTSNFPFRHVLLKSDAVKWTGRKGAGFRKEKMGHGNDRRLIDGIC